MCRDETGLVKGECERCNRLQESFSVLINAEEKLKCVMLDSLYRCPRV